MTFQSNVIIIATIILIGLLIFIGFSLKKNKTKTKFPPVLAECPDYWDSYDNKCSNIHSLGTCNFDEPKDFTNNIYIGDSGDCEKYKWAKNCGVSWDGITNKTGICNNK